MDQAKQVGDEMTLTWGLGIVSSDAFAAGVAGMPDPAGDVGYPWLWWHSMHLFSYVAAGEEAFGVTAQRAEVDTKAMRRIKPDQTLLMLCQVSNVVGAVAVDITFGQLRVLVGT